MRLRPQSHSLGPPQEKESKGRRSRCCWKKPLANVVWAEGLVRTHYVLEGQARYGLHLRMRPLYEDSGVGRATHSTPILMGRPGVFSWNGSIYVARWPRTNLTSQFCATVARCHQGPRCVAGGEWGQGEKTFSALSAKTFSALSRAKSMLGRAAIVLILGKPKRPKPLFLCEFLGTCVAKCWFLILVGPKIDVISFYHLTPLPSFWWFLETLHVLVPWNSGFDMILHKLFGIVLLRGWFTCDPKTNAHVCM